MSAFIASAARRSSFRRPSTTQRSGSSGARTVAGNTRSCQAGSSPSRWLHPLTLALYAVIPDIKPIERAPTVARKVAARYSHKELTEIVKEIRLELNEPTQQIRDTLECRASEGELRQYLSSFCDWVDVFGNRTHSADVRSPMTLRDIYGQSCTVPIGGAVSALFGGRCLR